MTQGQHENASPTSSTDSYPISPQTDQLLSEYDSPELPLRPPIASYPATPPPPPSRQPPPRRRPRDEPDQTLQTPTKLRQTVHPTEKATLSMHESVEARRKQPARHATPATPSTTASSQHDDSDPFLDEAIAGSHDFGRDQSRSPTLMPPSLPPTSAPQQLQHEQQALSYLLRHDAQEPPRPQERRRSPAIAGPHNQSRSLALMPPSLPPAPPPQQLQQAQQAPPLPPRPPTRQETLAPREPLHHPLSAQQHSQPVHQQFHQGALHHQQMGPQHVLDGYYGQYGEYYAPYAPQSHPAAQENQQGPRFFHLQQQQQQAPHQNPLPPPPPPSPTVQHALPSSGLQPGPADGAGPSISSPAAVPISSTSGSANLATPVPNDLTPPSFPSFEITPPTPVAPPLAQEVVEGANGFGSADGADRDDFLDTPKKYRLFKTHRATIDELFDEIDAMISGLSTDTEIDMSYLLKKYLRRNDPSTKFAGENVWNDFTGAFKGEKFRTEELARANLTEEYERAQSHPDALSRVAESKAVVKKCYERFKEYYSVDETYKDILEACRELKQLNYMEKGVKINARERGFHLVFEKTVNKLRVLSNMYGYEFALAGTGSMILQDSGLAFLETSPRLQGFFENACRTDEDTLKGHLMAYACKTRSDEIIAQTWAQEGSDDGADVTMDDDTKSVLSVDNSGTRTPASGSSKAEDILAELRDALKAAFIAAGGTLPGSVWPWKRLLRTMIIYMIITDSWPSTVFTPAQTNDSLKGLAVLSPASRQALLNDVRSRTRKNPFFKKIDGKTWSKYYETNLRPVIGTTANTMGIRTVYYRNGNKGELGASGESFPSSSITSDLTALESGSHSSELESLPDSQPPTPLATKTRAKTVAKKVAVKTGRKEKQISGKGKEKAVDDDVLEISSDEAVPKSKKTATLSTSKPAYVSSGSDHEDASDYEDPSTSADLKRKLRASPQPDIPHLRSVRSRAGSPSPSQEHDVSPVARRSEQSKRLVVNLARPKAATNSQQASAPSQEHDMLPTATRPGRIRPTATNLARPKTMAAAGGFPSSRTPSPELRAQSAEFTEIRASSIGRGPAASSSSLGKLSQSAADRALMKDLNFYGRPNIGRGPSASSSSPSKPSHTLALEDAAPPAREGRTPTPTGRRATEASADIAAAAAAIDATTQGPLLDAPVAAATAQNLSAAPPPLAPRPPMVHAQSLQSAAPQQSEAALQMMNAQSSQGRAVAPQHEFVEMHHPAMHQGPPAQGFWGQPTYYHPQHAYPQGMPNYGHGYNPGAFAGQQIYHPQPPQQGPSNTSYNAPMPFAGQVYPPGHLLNQSQHHQQPQHAGSTLRGASPPVSPFMASDGNYQLRRPTDGPA